MTIKQWFYENKEGIVGGAILGTIMFFLWIKSNNVNILLDVAKNTAGMFNGLQNLPFFNGLSLPDFLMIRIWLGFVAFGIVIGAIADMLLPERIL